MRISSLLRGIVLAVLLSLTWVGLVTALEVGQKAPDFTLNGTDGKPVQAV